MTPDQEIYRANRAKEVLENEAYIEAFAAIRQELFEQWQNTPVRDVGARESLWVMFKQLDKLKITLEATMQGGNVAVLNLAHREKSKVQRIRDALR